MKVVLMGKKLKLSMVAAALLAALGCGESRDHAKSVKDNTMYPTHPAEILDRVTGDVFEYKKTVIAVPYDSLESKDGKNGFSVPLTIAMDKQDELYNAHFSARAVQGLSTSCTGKVEIYPVEKDADLFGLGFTTVIAVAGAGALTDVAQVHYPVERIVGQISGYSNGYQSLVTITTSGRVDANNVRYESPRRDQTGRAGRLDAILK
jgi:hypothetical protein